MGNTTPVGFHALSPAEEDRFLGYIRKQDESEDSCWYWSGTVNSDGYPEFRVGKRVAYAHRLMWMLMNGPIPGDLTVSHECHDQLLAQGLCKGGKSDPCRRCVRPDHLGLQSKLQQAQHTYRRTKVAA